MTAEVVIMNPEAVAIAADSAVTVPGKGINKVYTSANKLFALSAVEPVAVMVYGGASFGPIPWETVVKEHRNHIGRKAYDTIEEYASAFIRYLSSLVAHVPNAAQRNMVAQRVHWVLQQVLSSFALQTQDWPPNQNDILTAIEARIGKLQKRQALFDDLSNSDLEDLINDSLPDWSDFLDWVFDQNDLQPANDKNKSRARDLATIALRFDSPFNSGVVVAGFGTDQMLPALCHYTVDGIIAQTVRAARIDGEHIGDNGHQAVIYPLAQADMVAAFMEGIHPRFANKFANKLDRLIEKHTGEFRDQLRMRLEGSISAEVFSTLAPVMDDIESKITSEITIDYRKSLDRLRKDFSSKIMSSIQWLPKEELAEVAETLVSLTSFHSRVTPGIETVGEPIDVAVISKGDGLIWIKRKHYFTPELNHRYFEIDYQRHRYSSRNPKEVR